MARSRSDHAGAAGSIDGPRPGGLLDLVERVGNLLPDPVLLFVCCLLATWVASAVLSHVDFAEIDPRTQGADAHGAPQPPKTIAIENQLSPQALVTFLSSMVKTFTDFPPLGIVLVALLGVGVAEHVGFIGAVLKALLRVTPAALLTPMLLIVAMMSHTASDTGYVLVIPAGGIIFYNAGRHPVAGIVAAFAGVAGGFSANFIPSGLDAVLQGITEKSGQLVDPELSVNPLCNWYFCSASTALIALVGWFVTDRIIEPRLRATTAIDADPASLTRFEPLTAAELKGLAAGLATMLACVALLAVSAAPASSLLRSPLPEGSLTGAQAPMMKILVPLIFLFFLAPGIAYGYVAGTVKSHRDVVKGMSKSMGTMGYYLAMAFWAAQFVYSFNKSNLGALLAVKGAAGLKGLDLPPEATMVGIVLLTTAINLSIGSASAKWALLGPIFVPMLMELGFSPPLTQAGYRIGDSCTNIVSPLNPYFPLVVGYCQQYFKRTGVGTLISLMLPYSLCFLVGWTAMFLAYWQLGIPLGLQASYNYP